MCPLQGLHGVWLQVQLLWVVRGRLSPLLRLEALAHWDQLQSSSRIHYFSNYQVIIQGLVYHTKYGYTSICTNSFEWLERTERTPTSFHRLQLIVWILHFLRMCSALLEDIVRITVDRRKGRNAIDTGNFELIYKQVI